MSSTTKTVESYTVPYKQIGEHPKHAIFLRCPVDLKELTGKELEMVSHLCKAVNLMNILYWDLADTHMILFASIVGKMLKCPDLSETEKTTIENYRDILYLQNSPYSELPTKSHFLELDKARVSAILSLAFFETFNLSTQLMVSFFFCPTHFYSNCRCFQRRPRDCMQILL